MKCSCSDDTLVIQCTKHDIQTPIRWHFKILIVNGSQQDDFIVVSMSDKFIAHTHTLARRHQNIHKYRQHM